MRGIRHLLHADAYTIKGVQKILREHGVEQVKAFGRTSVAAAPEPAATGKRRIQGAQSVEALPAARRPAAGARGSQNPAGPAASRSGKPQQPGRKHVLAKAIAELEDLRKLLRDEAPGETRPVQRARAGRGV